MSARFYKKFLRGKAGYLLGQPRPKLPNENALSPRWLGWMIARSEDIQKIINELRVMEVDQTDAYDKIFSRRVLALDLQHGLSPWHGEHR